MNREPVAWTQPRAHRVSRMLAAAVLAVAGLVLLGRILDVPAVDALFSRLGIMPSDTAEAFCLAAIGLLLVRTTGWTREAGRVCLGLVAALGAMKLAQHATGLDLRIDPVLLHGPLVSDPGQPVHMSPIASLIFTLLGLGALLGARRNLPVASLGQSLLIVALLLTVHVLFGYAYGLESFYRPLTTAPMTFDAAVLFVPSTFACLYASGDRGLAAVFADPGPSGKFLRRMLPAMLVTPLLLGWAASAGRRMGYFGTGVMTAMVSTGNAVLLVGFLAWLVLSLRKADQRLRAVVEDLTASERMFRASFENAFVGMAHLDAARRWTRVNPRLAELLEYEPAALLGKRLEHLVDPEHLPLLEDRLRALQEREIDFTTGRQHWVTSQGQDRWFDVHASGRWSEDGLFKHFILVFQDVTAARRIAEQMRIQARSLEAAGTGIIITDARQSDYPIVYVNSAFERLTGYDRDEVIGSNARFLNRLAREQPELADVRQALRLGRPCSVVLQNHAKDGTPFWNELTLAPWSTTWAR
jgi:PAS domain S-box-containing protein